MAEVGFNVGIRWNKPYVLNAGLSTAGNLASGRGCKSRFADWPGVGLLEGG